MASWRALGSYKNSGYIIYNINTTKQALSHTSPRENEPALNHNILAMARPSLPSPCSLLLCSDNELLLTDLAGRAVPLLLGTTLRVSGSCVILSPVAHVLPPWQFPLGPMA